MLTVMKGAGKEYVTMDIVVINYKHDFSNRCLRGHHIFKKKFHMYYRFKEIGETDQ